MSELFKFPKTRKTRAAKQFIKAVESARANDSELDEVQRKGKAEKSRLQKIVHDPAASYGERLQAMALLEFVPKLDKDIYDKKVMASRSANDVECHELYGEAMDEAEIAGQAEIEDLLKKMPKGVNIAVEDIETPAVRAFRKLDNTHPQARARELYKVLTA